MFEGSLESTQGMPLGKTKGRNFYSNKGWKTAMKFSLDRLEPEHDRGDQSTSASADMPLSPRCWVFICSLDGKFNESRATKEERMFFGGIMLFWT